MEHRTLLAGLAPDTVIDVGADKGQFSLVAAALHPQAAIHAVEPLPGAADTFERRPDCSSPLPIGAGQVRYAPDSAPAGTRPVPIVPLDALLPADAVARPCLLKLDVQADLLFRRIPGNA